MGTYKRSIMKIGICGTQCIGKTTFCEDFVKNWTKYKFIKHNYAKKKGITLNKEGTEDSQEYILNKLIDQLQETTTNYAIYDRTIIDNLVYTLWLSANNKVSDEFVKKCIDITRESLIMYDLIFFCPITKFSPIEFVPSKNRDNDLKYREEVDVLFKSLMNAYVKQSNIYFPIQHPKGCPAIIEMFGNRDERIQLAKLYIKPNGKIITDSALTED
jgi:GTPase SAR1 family protein